MCVKAFFAQLLILDFLIFLNYRYILQITAHLHLSAANADLPRENLRLLVALPKYHLPHPYLSMTNFNLKSSTPCCGP